MCVCVYLQVYVILEKRKQKILKCTIKNKVIITGWKFVCLFFLLKHELKSVSSLSNHQKIHFTHCEGSPFTSPDEFTVDIRTHPQSRQLEYQSMRKNKYEYSILWLKYTWNTEKCMCLLFCQRTFKTLCGSEEAEMDTNGKELTTFCPWLIYAKKWGEMSEYSL